MKIGDLSQYGEVMAHHLATSCHIHRPFPQTLLKTAPHIMKLKFWYNSLVHINVKVCKNYTLQTKLGLDLQERHI